MKAGLSVSLLMRLVLLGLFSPALLFLASGDFGWVEGWAYSGFALAYTVFGRLALFKRTPGLAAERAAGFRRDDVEPWDKKLVPWIGMLLPVLMMIAAGLERRLGGPSVVPAAVRWAAAPPVVAGAFLGLAAALRNPFFSSVARIQPDRGQFVVASGPYRLVRHPGYAGSVLFNLFTPLFLGSLGALVPGTILVVLIVVRTRLEDRMLCAKLEGYRDYAARTRYRLVPGVW